jgi:hypothetical protein
MNKKPKNNMRLLCRTIRSRGGFFSIEYAIVILVIVAALISMGVFMQRALSDRYRSAGDSFGFGRQYGQ